MQDLKTITDKAIPVGMNNRYFIADIPEGFCSLAQNCFLEENKIKQRYGYSVAGTNTNTLEESKAVLGMGYFNDGTTKHLIKAYDNSAGTQTDMYYWTGSGDWTKMVTKNFATQTLDVEMEMANGKLYATNGADTVLSWDGTTQADAVGFPIDKYIKWFHNYMFGLNDGTNKSRLHISNLGAPDTWGASDYIDVGPKDGGEGSGLGFFKNELIIGKTNRIYYLSGWGSASWTVNNVTQSTSYGVKAGRTMLDCGTYFLYLTMVGDIPHIVALARTQYDTIIFGGIMSIDIEGTMKTINKSQMSKACGIFDGKRAWFFVPTGSSIYNDTAIVVDMTKGTFGDDGVWHGGWSYHTGIRASDIVISNVVGYDKIYFGEGNATKKSKAYVMDTSTTDNGDAIEFDYQTRALQPNFEYPFKWKYLWLRGETVGNVSVNIYASASGYQWDTIGTFALNPTGSILPFTFPLVLGDQKWREQRYDISYPRKRTMQLRLQKSNTGTPVVMNSYSFMGKLRPLGST